MAISISFYDTTIHPLNYSHLYSLPGCFFVSHPAVPGKKAWPLQKFENLVGNYFI